MIAAGVHPTMVPGIGTLGPDRSPATAVAVGAVAAGPLWSPDAWRPMGRTIAAPFPIGDHGFTTVPAVVIGGHEATHGRLLAEGATRSVNRERPAGTDPASDGRPGSGSGVGPTAGSDAPGETERARGDPR